MQFHSPLLLWEAQFEALYQFKWFFVHQPTDRPNDKFPCNQKHPFGAYTKEEEC